MPAQRPDDTRVRGAGPTRKTGPQAESIPAPHPLQPIVRRRPAGTALEQKGARTVEVPHGCRQSYFVMPGLPRVDGPDIGVEQNISPILGNSESKRELQNDSSVPIFSILLLDKIHLSADKQRNCPS